MPPHRVPGNRAASVSLQSLAIVLNNPTDAFERAFGLHRDGKHEQALSAYEAVLERWPGHADALHYSGILLYQAGRLDVATANIERSLKIAPGVAEAWCNLALVY